MMQDKFRGFFTILVGIFALLANALREPGRKVKRRAAKRKPAKPKTKNKLP